MGCRREAGTTTIFVDADACPATRDAIALARPRSLPVVLVANQSQTFLALRGAPA